MPSSGHTHQINSQQKSIVLQVNLHLLLPFPMACHHLERVWCARFSALLASHCRRLRLRLTPFCGTNYTATEIAFTIPVSHTANKNVPVCSTLLCVNFDRRHYENVHLAPLTCANREICRGVVALQRRRRRRWRQWRRPMLINLFFFCRPLFLFIKQRFLRWAWTHAPAHAGRTLMAKSGNLFPHLHWMFFERFTSLSLVLMEREKTIGFQYK